MTRKRLSSILLVIFMLAILPGTVLASPSIVLNGDKLSFDVPPLIENGRTLVPLRTIFEAIGATVTWDSNTQTVTAVKGLNTIKLQIGSYTATKNNQIVNLDIPGRAVNGRTLVPLRFVSEAMGCQVGWAGETQAVVITENSDPDSKTLIYSDPKGRFAFTYPKDWIIRTDLPETPYVIDLVVYAGPGQSVSSNYAANIIIGVQNINGQNVNIDLFKTNSLDTCKRMYTNVQLLSEKNLIISGNSASEQQISFTAGIYSLLAKETFIYNNSFFCDTLINTALNENSELRNKFDTLLNSIKLVDFTKN